MGALLWIKEKREVLTVFLGIYMKSDMTRKPSTQLTGICPSLDLVERLEEERPSMYIEYVSSQGPK